jgi:ferric-dicitrate binding protein FerR (iron transport regulator)
MQMRLRITAMLAFVTLSLWPFGSEHALGQVRHLATARQATGWVTVMRPDGIETQLVAPAPLALFEHDVVVTGANGRVVLDIGDGIQITLDENTTSTMLYRWEKATGLTPIVRLRKGEIAVKTSRGAAALDIETPVAVIATPPKAEFRVRVDVEGNTLVTVVRGAVDVANALNTCRVRDTQTTALVRGRGCPGALASDAPPPDAATPPATLP